MTSVELVASADLAPLQRRFALLQMLRVGLGLAICLAGVLMPGFLGVRRSVSLAMVSLLYAGGIAAVEVVQRRADLRSEALVSGLVLIDGIYLAIAMSLTGGPQSALSFFVLVHVIAVTLLLSFRTGLKTALWHALLLFAVSWLHHAGVVAQVSADGPDKAAAVRAVALLAVAISAACFSSLNERELRRGKAELRALAEMAARLAAVREPSQIVGALLSGVSKAFTFPRAAVLLDDGGTWRAYVGAPGADQGVTQVADGPASDGVAHARRAASEAVLERSLDPKRDPLLSRALPGAVNVVVIPLMVDGRQSGVLAVERGGAGNARITRRTVVLLTQFAAHASLALQAAALQAEVERLAGTDGLTGLANRRVFQLALSRELAMADRRGEPCTLVILDVDHFKAVNDTHGHQAGDEVLRRVGHALAQVARDSDVAARYGGEEFAVILPNCPPEKAAMVAERFRTAVLGDPGPVPVTVSAGVATYPRDAGDGESLIGAADQALYKAKKTGRDRVVVFRRPRRQSAA